MRARLFLGFVVMATLVAEHGVRAQRKPSIDPTPFLDHIAHHLNDYYSRAQSLVSREEVTHQPIKPDLSFDGMPTRFAFRLRLEWSPPENGAEAGATMLRELLTVNGRVPKPKDKPKCLQPRESWSEPLAMFLPEARHEFTFKWAGAGRMDGVNTVSIDFEEHKSPVRPEPQEASAREGVEDEDSCISYSVVGQVKGRVWVSPETGEVLRLDQSIYGPLDIKLPKKVQPRWQTTFLTVDRYSTSIRYKRVSFQDPEESLVLPESIQTVHVTRGGSGGGSRITQRFTNYRRFITGGRLVEE